jgi:hypothetical protein
MRDFQAIFAQIHSVTLVNSLNVEIRRRVQLRYILCYADDAEGVAAESRSHSYVIRYQLSDFYDFYDLYDLTTRRINNLTVSHRVSVPPPRRVVLLPAD